ncbi:hypothetical protein D3C87_1317940 [compost metagenome]
MLWLSRESANSSSFFWKDSTLLAAGDSSEGVFTSRTSTPWMMFILLMNPSPLTSSRFCANPQNTSASVRNTAIPLRSLSLACERIRIRLNWSFIKLALSLSAVSFTAKACA